MRNLFTICLHRVRDDLDAGSRLAPRQQLQCGGGRQVASSSPLSFHRVGNERNESFPAALASYITQVMFLRLPYMIAKDKGPAGPHNPLAMTLEKLDGMPASVRRVIKTHLPFHLLHPRLIETSKVWCAAWGETTYLLLNLSLSGVRWCTWLAIPKTSSSPTSTTTS